MATTETAYKLDKNDRIIEVSPAWDQFATQNSGEQACASLVVGRLLREFISGDATQMWIMSLIASARTTEKVITKFYRCDSPSEKRYMKMTIWPEEDGVISVSNKLLRVERMKKTISFNYKKEAFIERCSVCNKIHVQSLWLEPDDAMVLGFLNEESYMDVVYSICNSCATVLNIQ